MTSRSIRGIIKSSLIGSRRWLVWRIRACRYIVYRHWVTATKTVLSISSISIYHSTPTAFTCNLSSFLRLTASLRWFYLIWWIRRIKQTCLSNTENRAICETMEWSVHIKQLSDNRKTLYQMRKRSVNKTLTYHRRCKKQRILVGVSQP